MKMRVHPCWFLLLCLAEAAAGRTPPSAPTATALKRIPLEELASMEVISVSRRAEELWRAAAAIDVVTGDGLRRAGANDLPDALRLATGLDVAQANGRTWAVNARGFVTTTANKLEVLMDGRSLYSSLFSGVFWDVQQTVLADLARIEVIRGPGAVQWGANAVNGVINIISRPAGETQGSLVEVSAGNEERLQAVVRHGGALPGGHYRAYALARERDELRTASGAAARDGLRLMQGGVRVDLGWGEEKLTIQGDAYDGEASQPTGNDIALRGGNLLCRWTGGPTVLQFYYDRVEREIPGVFAEERDTFDLQGQRQFVFERGSLLAGARARISADRIGNSATIQFLPARRTLKLFSAFAQAETTLPDSRWRLCAGTTLEHNSYTGVELQPTVRAVLAEAEAHTWWGAVSRAVRTPSRIDTDFFARTSTGAPIIVGGGDFKSEEFLAAELGWRWRPNARWLTDLAVFHHWYDDLRSQEPVGAGPVPIVLRNKLNARTKGAELTVTWQPALWLNAKLGWRELDKDFTLDPGSRDTTRGTAEGNDPRRLGFVQASFDLQHEVSLDVVLRYTGTRPAPRVPGVLEADVRIAGRAGRDYEWALTGRNLLDRAHRQFGAAGPAAGEVERSWFLTLSWRR